MIDLNILKSSLFQKKTNAIDLKNNSTIFSIFITSKIEFRSKNNLTTSIKNAQRDVEKTFIKNAIAMTDAQILRNRTNNFNKKIQALLKQFAAYEKTVDKMKIKTSKKTKVLNEKSLKTHEMKYIKKHLFLNKKEVNRYILNHENHFIVTVEKFKNEMIEFVAYIQRAEKRLRDLIALKIAANLKICQDIKNFEKFEVAT